MHFFKALAATLLALGTTMSAHSQSYPSKPIKIIVPFAPGGTTDSLARTMASLLQPKLGVSVIVENKAGASGAIGIEAAARSPADGYTILWGTDAVVVQPLLRKNFPIDPHRDLEPLLQIGYTPMLISVNKNVPVHDLKQLIAAAKAKPGTLRYGSGGSGTILHITGERFKLATGIDMLHVPYKGTGPAVLDAVGGHIEVVVTGVAEVIQQVRNGDLRALAYTGDSRAPMLPNVPTVAELGYPGFFAAGWVGALVPAGTPPTIVTQLSDEIFTAAQSPEFQKLATTAGMVGVMNKRAETAKFLRVQSDRFKEVIEKAHITSD